MKHGKFNDKAKTIYQECPCQLSYHLRLALLELELGGVIGVVTGVGGLGDAVDHSEGMDANSKGKK